jgi:hypothetical protein
MSETIEIVAEFAGTQSVTSTTEISTETEQGSQGKPFPVDCLPQVLSDMANGISDIAGVPPEMSGPLVLAVASASTGRGVRLNSINNHQTSSNLYLLFSKQSGSGGSTAFKLASAPFYGREAQLRRDFEENDKPGAEAERDAATAEIARGQSLLKKDKVEDRAGILESLKDARKRLAEAERAVIAPLLAMSDSTPEGASKILSEQGECLFHADADAGDAIKAAMGGYQEGNGPSESLWLKAFSGEGITITRRNSLTVKLERPTLALCWIMTPESMRELFSRERLSEGGFLARCLVANIPGLARAIPETAADEARKIAAEVAQPFEAAIWASINTYRLGPFNDDPAEIGMTPTARLEFIRDWNRMIEKHGGKPDPFTARHTEQAIRIALVIHLFHHIEIEKRGPGTWGVSEGGLTGHTRPLDVRVARAALLVRDWFAEQQAALLAPQKASAEEALWEKVRRKVLSSPTGITARDLYSGNFATKTAKEAEELLARWVEDGWLEKIEPKGGGAGRKVARYTLPRSPFRG